MVDANATSPSPLALDETNAVWSRTFNWYDASRRLIATADYGTGDTGNQYVVSDAPPVPTWYDPPVGPEIDPEATSNQIDRAGVPSDVPLTIYHFDRRGNQDYLASPTGAITKLEYTGTGKVGRKTENYFELGDDPARVTEYEYRFGRLSSVRAARLAGSSPATQVTDLKFGANEENEWGAEVIDVGATAAGTRVVSAHGGHVRSMHLPTAVDESNPDPDLLMRYDFLGRIAERVDARGIVSRYAYDDLDRLVEVEVGRYVLDGENLEFEPEYPEDLGFGMSAEVPGDRIGFVTYIYTDPNMKTFEVKAWNSRAASSGTPIAHNKMEFNGRGQLIADWQSYGATIVTSGSGATPKTAYTWDVQFSEADGWPVGYNRLSAMHYPPPPGFSSTSARVVTFGHGTSTYPDDMLSRLATMTTAIGSGSSSQVAAFTYVGTGRRALMTLATGLIAQDLGLDTNTTGGIGLTGLDRFGRMADLNWRQASSGTLGTSLTRIEYEYDIEGNRAAATRTPRPTSGGGTSPVEEQTNSYDALNRLVTSLIEHTPTSGSGMTLIRDDTWNLDLLGNWSGLASGSANDGRIMLSDITSDLTDEHNVDNRNQIVSIDRTVNGGSVSNTATRYDAAGNLMFDGTYAYQYDAWGRLLQINEAHLESPDPEPVLDDIVKHFAYDGLGRLIRVQSPYPAPGYEEVRSERLFYDGIRRIQEVWIDPVDNNDDSAMAGGEEALAAFVAEPNLDGDTATLGVENEQMEAASSGGGGGVSPPGVTLEREYIWGPGNNGVDELLVQYDRSREAWWVLQDAGLDAIALCDLGTSGTAARIVWQVSYDAYGSVLTAENPGSVAYAYLRAGHKGLFFDRLDVGVMNSSSSEENRRLEPGAKLLGQVRNRAYAPDLGRFVQRDPHATGLALVCSAWTGVPAVMPEINGFDLSSHYGDGPSVYQYVIGNTWTNSDPEGCLVRGLALLLPGPSDMITGALQGMVEEYAARQMWDVEWAMDWSMGDDWHTRNDSEWVYVAMAEGVYNSFAIGIPGTDIGFNPLDDPGDLLFASGVADPALQIALGKPIQAHHIMARSQRARYEVLFKRLGIRFSLDDPDNIVRMYHSGRHNKQYHDWVYGEIRKATDGLKGKAAEDAVRRQLRYMKPMLRTNPDFLYNSCGGRYTKFRGMRHYMTFLRGRYRFRMP